MGRANLACMLTSIALAASMAQVRAHALCHQTLWSVHCRSAEGNQHDVCCRSYLCHRQCLFLSPSYGQR